MSRGARGGWLIVVGARPNFVKAMPLLAAARRARLPMGWLHTGQQIDPRLTRDLAREMKLPAPWTRLRQVPPGDDRIARMTERLGAAIQRLRPRGLVLLGDVDSTAAGAHAATRAGLPSVHVEGGLRSGDATMPEERNRILADAVADRIYLTEGEARDNLRAEGIPARRVRVPGNVMADALRAVAPRVRAAPWPRGVPREGDFVLATLHRQANVDRAARRRAWLAALTRVAAKTPVLLPLHPRTADRMAREDGRRRMQGITFLPPLRWLAFLRVLAEARVVATDSGGVPVEAALLGVPCLTLRPVCEHQSTLRLGTNRLVPDPRGLSEAIAAARAPARPPRPRIWDGRAAERIVADLARFGG